MPIATKLGAYFTPIGTVAFPFTLSLSDRQNDSKMLSRRAAITWKRPKGASSYSTYSFLLMIDNILLAELSFENAS